MRALLPVTCLLLLVGSLIVRSVPSDKFQKQDGIFTGTPNEVVPAATSGLICAVLCGKRGPQSCFGFSYQGGGVCSMFTADQLKDGSVTLAPEAGSSSVSYKRIGMLPICDLNPRTAGGLSHLRTAGGGGADDRPPENSKTKKDSDKR